MQCKQTADNIGNMIYVYRGDHPYETTYRPTISLLQYQL